MTDQNAPEDVFVANPDDFEEIDEYTPKPGWIKPVGIISIVWGAIGVLLSLLGLVGYFVTPKLMESIPGGVPEVYSDPPMTQLIMVAAGIIISVWLIAGGISLLLGAASSRIMFLVYALAGVASAIFGSWYGLEVRQQVNEWVEANPDAQFAQQTGSQEFQLGFMIFGLVLGLAWPVFSAVWFGIVKTKPEHYGNSLADIT
ncbi:MAG: hypothetical protein ACYTF7_11115 [Planctomycetota bacterium]|jgi:hypothetical protein